MTQKRKFNFIITLQGLLLLLLAIVLIFGLGFPYKDIIATVIGFALLLFIFILIILNYFQRKKIAKDLKLKIFPPEENELYSNKDTQLILKLSPMNLLPLFYSKINLKYNFKNPFSKELIISGNSNIERNISLDTKFPHRGKWNLENLKITVEDRFGVTRQIWKTKIFDNLKVRPPAGNTSKVPVLSSFHKAGDDIYGQNQRLGELYDLKKYHPSDGAKKILWKVFAKSRELISRHPEPSFSPEGQIAVFCIAGITDDNVCSSALSYLKLTENSDIDVFFGCIGSNIIAQNREEAEDILIKSVSSTLLKNTPDILNEVEFFITQVVNNSPNSSISKLIIFCSPELLNNKDALDAYTNVGTMLSNQGIEPIFCLPKFSSLPSSNYEENSSFQNKVKSFLFIKDKSKSNKILSFYPDFINACLKYQWQVYS